MTVPISSTDRHEGVADPKTLSFTPDNWNASQSVTVTGQDDCIVDGNKAYQILVGKAISTDANYMGPSGAPVNAVNQDKGDTAASTQFAGYPHLQIRRHCGQ